MGLKKGQKIRMLTLKQKAAIIEQIKKGKRVTVCPKEFSVSKGTICNIKRNEKQITARIANTFSGPGKMCTIKKAEHPRMERILYKWFLNQKCSDKRKHFKRESQTVVYKV